MVLSKVTTIVHPVAVVAFGALKLKVPSCIISNNNINKVLELILTECTLIQSDEATYRKKPFAFAL